MSLDANTTCDDFAVADMFFSRTDKRGVIQSGNTVFQRISGYQWDELIGAPHKLVRHPDMPKGVFQLFWDTIRKDRVIGAYVCNRTKAGDPYWVFATVFPLENGYLSVRIKPTTTMLEKVVPIYNELTALEKSGEASPEQSAAMLLDRVRELGFSNYQEFMAIALTDELQSHTKRMGNQADPTLSALSKTLNCTAELEDCANRVQISFRDTHQIPYNMRLQAGRIEGSDGPISVISGNHRQMSLGLETVVAAFSVSSRESTADICASSLEIAMSKVLSDMRAAFLAENSEDTPNKGDILTLLDTFSETYRSKSLVTLAATARGMRRFRKQSRQMRRALSGLELTRIMCRIERFKIGGEHSGLDEIVNRLAMAQKSLEGSCDEIERLATMILGFAEGLLRDQKALAA
jgi:aerotaxis receptor